MESANQSSQHSRLIVAFFRILSMVVFGGGLWLALIHPVWPITQFVLVVVCFGITVIFPFSWPFLFPILLVAGDAYPFTGQLVVQEYDSMLLGSFAGWIFRGEGRGARSEKRGARGEGQEARVEMGQRFLTAGLVWAWGPWIFLGLSVVVAMSLGLSRLPVAPWGDQLSVYFTGLNSLRIAKGYIWGILFAGCALSASASGGGFKWRKHFVWGMQCAMLYVGCFMIVERWLFESLFDFSREFRASGPFFTMHIGDQHVDAFIALSIPFAFVATKQAKWMPRIATGIGLVSLMLYAAVATMSRATIAAVVIEVVLLLFVVNLAQSRANTRFRWIRWIRVCLSVGVASILAVSVCLLVWKGEALRKRFETVQSDWQGRVGHWTRALELSSNGWMDCTFGHGMGTFPTAMATDMGHAIPPLSWRPDHGGEIELKGSWPIYLEQTRWPVTSESISLHFDAERFPQTGPDVSTLRFYRCYKSVFHSFEMTQETVSLFGKSSNPLDIELSNAQIDDSSPAQRRFRPETYGVSLSGTSRVTIRNPTSSAAIKESLGKRSPISRKSSAPWCFTCDNHLVWRAKNFAVHLYYELGLLGLISAALLVGVWITPNEKQLDQSFCFDQALARVSLVGFLIVACFGTLVDTPWIIAILLAVGSHNQSFFMGSRAVGQL